MIRMFATSLLLLAGASVFAQQQVKDKAAAPAAKEEAKAAETPAPLPGNTPERVDLTRIPDAPAPQAAPNQSLLQPGGQAPAQPYRTMQTNTGFNGSTQQVNATSSQINLGGKPATSTIYYDNSGKMTGTSTTIKLGK